MTTTVLVLALIGSAIFFLDREKKLKQESINNFEKLIKTEENLKAIREDLYTLTSNSKDLEDQLLIEQEKNSKIVSQKKSSETRLGQITEHLIPFLEGCPYDTKNLHFLGNPIDYVHFDFDEGSITFLEVKTGNSKSSKRQKLLKNVIRTGRVFYDELRVNEKGMKIKKAQNLD